MTVNKVHPEYFYANYGFHSVPETEANTIKIVRIKGSENLNHCFISVS